MSVAIEVVLGPEKGWKYVLTSGEVRVGRGAGHQVKLDDPAWGGGHLRVQFRQGGYVVGNRMGHAVLFDGRPLADGEQLTWFTGVCLQPTGGTLLRLVSAEVPAGASAEGGVVPVPPGQATDPKKTRLNNWIAFGVLLLAAAGLGAKQLLTPKPPPVAAVLDAVIRPELEAELPDGRGEAVASVIQKGMVYRSKGDGPAARQKYDEARRLLAAAAGPVGRDKWPPPLRTADLFVAELMEAEALSAASE
jgi:hypothetical protein